MTWSLIPKRSIFSKASWKKKHLGTTSLEKDHQLDQETLRTQGHQSTPPNDIREFKNTTPQNGWSKLMKKIIKNTMKKKKLVEIINMNRNKKVDTNQAMDKINTKMWIKILTIQGFKKIKVTIHQLFNKVQWLIDWILPIDWMLAITQESLVLIGLRRWDLRLTTKTNLAKKKMTPTAKNNYPGLKIRKLIVTTEGQSWARTKV